MNPNCKKYKSYGGRGIILYSEWELSPIAFINYVSKLPHYGEYGYSLDRIDNDGNYEPGNIRWADKRTQASNRRNCNRHGYIGIKEWRGKYWGAIEFNGEAHNFGPFKTVREAAKARDIFIIRNNINPIHLQILKKK